MSRTSVPRPPWRRRRSWAWVRLTRPIALVAATATVVGFAFIAEAGSPNWHETLRIGIAMAALVAAAAVYNGRSGLPPRPAGAPLASRRIGPGRDGGSPAAGGRLGTRGVGRRGLAGLALLLALRRGPPSPRSSIPLRSSAPPSPGSPSRSPSCSSRSGSTTRWAASTTCSGGRSRLAGPAVSPSISPTSCPTTSGTTSTAGGTCFTWLPSPPPSRSPGRPSPHS